MTRRSRQMAGWLGGGIALALAVPAPGAWLGLSHGARLKVGVESNRVTLSSRNWDVVLAGGMVTGVKSHLTDEVFAEPGQGIPATVPVGLGVQTGAIEEARRLHGPWGTIDLKQGETSTAGTFPSQHRPYAGSKLTVAQPDRLSVTMTWQGLGAGTNRYPDEVFTLTARLDSKTGDLVLSSGGTAADGVYGAAVGVANLDKSLRAYVAHMGGMMFDADWPKAQISLGDGGPFLEAPVIALESRQGGSLAVWAQDATFRPKNLFWQNTPDRFNLIWQTRNVMPFAPQKTAQSVEWRLNCYRGAWTAALEPYRTWFHRAFAADIARRPAWAGNIRVIAPILPTSEEQMKKIAAVFKPEQVLLHAWSARKQSFDTELPDFTPNESFIQAVSNAHRLGFHASAYVNAVCINKDAKVTEAYDLQKNVLLRGKLFGDPAPAWEALKSGDIVYTDPLSPGWRSLHARLMKEFVDRTQVDALYEDCAGTCGDFGHGIVDGLAPLQGTYALMKQTAAAIPPETAFSSEYHVERTAPFDSWALHGTGWGGPEFLKRRHVNGRPVNTCIWGSGVMAWIHAGDPDLADVLGGLDPISDIWLDATRGSQGYGMFRAKLFASRQLRPAFPKAAWAPETLACYEDGQGRIYRLVERSGHVMLGPDGRELYRRTRGLCRVTTELAIRGWPAYGAEGPVGLDPAWEYCLIPGRRDETKVQVRSLSEGTFVRGYREGRGFLLVSLATAAGVTSPPMVRVEYRVSAKVLQTVIDGRAVQPQPAGNGWQLDVPPEATVVFLLGQAEPPAADGLVGGLHDAGVILPKAGPELELEMQRGKLHEPAIQIPGSDKSWPAFLAATPAGVRLNFDYVVTPPATDSVLRVYGYHVPQKYGDGQRAMLWVNGKPMFDTPLPRDEGKVHQWDVPLGPYAGQPVLVTLAGDPGGDGNCDNLRLTRPRIVPDPAVKEPAHKIW